MKFFTTVKCYDDVTTLKENDLICYCCQIDKRTIVNAIHNGATTLKVIKEMTNACTGSECKVLNPNKPKFRIRNSQISTNHLPIGALLKFSNYLPGSPSNFNKVPIGKALALLYKSLMQNLG